MDVLKAWTKTKKAYWALQLTSVLPQYVDYGGDPEYFSEVLDSIFQQFMDKYDDSSDPEIVKHTQEIQQLLNDRQLTKTFVNTMMSSLRVLGNTASWATIANKFEVDCQRLLSDVPNVLVKASKKLRLASSRTAPVPSSPRRNTSMSPKLFGCSRRTETTTR